jgi:hypothetical protein
VLEYYIIIIFLDRRAVLTIHAAVTARNNSATKSAKKLPFHLFQQQKSRAAGARLTTKSKLNKQL